MTKSSDVHIKSPNAKELIAFSAMVVGVFMAVLDVQVVSSSLPVIGAGLGASADQLSWVQTSYLIAEVIVIPITGFISSVLSTRISFFLAALIFTIASFLCALANGISDMILFRTIQGFFGGAMIPTVFSVTFRIFPIDKQASVNMLIGLVVTIAPTIGPTVGGYITEKLSWHFMFLLNVIPGILVSTIIFLYADFDKPNYKLLKNFDYIGIVSLAVSLGSLQYILEEGPKHNWLSDNVVLGFTIITIISAIVFFAREFTAQHPVIDLRIFKNKNFAFGCSFSFILGSGLFGIVYLMPFFLFTIAGYSSMQIGMTMIVTGVAQFISAPIAGKMVNSGTDLRIVASIGFALFGLGCYMNGFLSIDARFWEFFVPQLLRGMSVMFCFIPINSITLGLLKKEEIPNASGIYNLVRNLGGAICIAMIGSKLISWTAMAKLYLNENIHNSGSNSQHVLTMLKYAFTGSSHDPNLASYAALESIVEANAFVIATNNIFMSIGFLFFIGLAIIPFSSRVIIMKEGGGH
ncbi:MAG: DHA2 family efflux MFS transporter permease subunit [Rickettsiaceae bacterium]